MEELHNMCASPLNYFMTGAPMNRHHLSCCLLFHAGIRRSNPTIKHCVTRLKHDPSFGGTHYALQIASLVGVAQTF